MAYEYIPKEYLPYRDEIRRKLSILGLAMRREAHEKDDYRGSRIRIEFHEFSIPDVSMHFNPAILFRDLFRNLLKPSEKIGYCRAEGIKNQYLCLSTTAPKSFLTLLDRLISYCQALQDRLMPFLPLNKHKTIKLLDLIGIARTTLIDRPKPGLFLQDFRELLTSMSCWPMNSAEEVAKFILPKDAKQAIEYFLPEGETLDKASQIALSQSFVTIARQDREKRLIDKQGIYWTQLSLPELYLLREQRLMITPEQDDSHNNYYMSVEQRHYLGAVTMPDSAKFTLSISPAAPSNLLSSVMRENLSRTPGLTALLPKLRLPAPSGVVHAAIDESIIAPALNQYIALPTETATQLGNVMRSYPLSKKPGIITTEAMDDFIYPGIACQEDIRVKLIDQSDQFAQLFMHYLIVAKKYAQYRHASFPYDMLPSVEEKMLPHALNSRLFKIGFDYFANAFSRVYGVLLPLMFTALKSRTRSAMSALRKQHASLCAAYPGCVLPLTHQKLELLISETELSHLLSLELNNGRILALKALSRELPGIGKHERSTSAVVTPFLAAENSRERPHRRVRTTEPVSTEV